MPFVFFYFNAIFIKRPVSTVTQGKHTPPCVIMARLMHISEHTQHKARGRRGGNHCHDALVSVCLCIYWRFYAVHVYLCVGENTCVQRPEADAWCLSPSFSALSSQTGTLHVSWDSPLHLSWLTNGLQASICLCLPRAGSQAPATCLAFIWMFGIQTQLLKFP